MLTDLVFPFVLILWRSSSTIGDPFNVQTTSGFGLQPTSQTNLLMKEISC
jgi:hypothetical protein